MSIPQESIYAVQAAMEQWSDQRVILADDLEDLLLFWRYVPNALSQLGMRLLGFQLRQRDGQYLLTVKVAQGSTPLVTFLTAASTMGCVRLFVSQLDDDRLSWHRDKYPWI